MQSQWYDLKQIARPYFHSNEIGKKYNPNLPDKPLSNCTHDTLIPRNISNNTTKKQYTRMKPFNDLLRCRG